MTNRLASEKNGKGKILSQVKSADKEEKGVSTTATPLELTETGEIAGLLREYFPKFSEENLRHLFDNPDALLHGKEGISAPGFVLRRGEKRVGYQSCVCREVFWGQTLLLAGIHGNTYVRKEARDDLATLILAILGQKGYDLHLANTANKNSVKISRVLRSGLGPDSCSQTAFRILSRSGFLTFISGKIPAVRACPRLWRSAAAKGAALFWTIFGGGSSPEIPPERTPLVSRRIDRIRPEVFDPFWSDLLASNNGLLTSRRTDLLCWTFQKGLDNGQKIMLGRFDERGRLRGDVVLRVSDDDGLRRFQIIDWIAVKNDEKILGDLLRDAILYAQTNGGFILEVIGFADNIQPLIRRYLPAARRNESNSFSLRFNDPALNRSAREMGEKGWFYGPYDGDRGWN